MKYAWIKEHSDSFTVALMCDVLGVSSLGYYGSFKRKPSARAERHERIKRCVQETHEATHGIFGSCKIADIMQKDDVMESACRNTVAAAMRELGIQSRVLKQFRPTTSRTGRAAENP